MAKYLLLKHYRGPPKAINEGFSCNGVGPVA
jgi:hypothetical protein